MDDSSGPRETSELKAVPPSNWIDGEMIVGAFPLAESETTAAIDLPSKDSLLRGVRLIVPPIGGGSVDDLMLRRRISNELGYFLAGWFEEDLTYLIQLYDSLVSPEVREHYRSGSVTIRWDEPVTAYYYLAFEVVPWIVQAVGEPDVFHCVSLACPLTAKQAITKGGAAAYRPLGPLGPLLARSTPGLRRYHLVDRSAEHAPNVFDHYLTNVGVVAKAGVRRRLYTLRTSEPAAYFYGIRINLDLDRMAQDGSRRCGT